MAIKEWTTNYPTSQDPSPVTGVQPDLDDESAPGLADGDETRSSHPESLRDKLDAVAKKVGDDSSLPAGSLLARVDALEVAPTTHATTHQSGGGDAIKLDDLAAPDDNTDLDASPAAHGLLPKLSGTATEYLDGSGSFSTPQDAAAIHDNVAGEIVAVTEKTTPVGTDVLIIEDSADSNNKKRVQITNLPSGSTSPLTTKGDLYTYDTGDQRLAVGTDGHVLTADSAEATGVKWAAAAGGVDANAIHDNTAAEISVITEKITPVATDLIIIEDSAAANAKKRVQIGNLPSGGGGSAPITVDSHPAVPNAKDDEFEGASIDPKWTWEGAGAPSAGGESNGVTKGSLFYDIWGDTGVGGAYATDGHFLMQPVPAGNWTVDTHFLVDQENIVSFARAGIWIRAATFADGLYLGMDIQGSPGVNTRVDYYNIVSSVFGATANAGYNFGTTFDVYLRVAYNSAAPLLTMSYSFDGIYYRTFGGSNTVTPSWTPAAFGLFGWALSVGAVSKIRCSAQWFRVT